MHSVFVKINYGGLKHNRLYLGLVSPSGGWQSPINSETNKATVFVKAGEKWLTITKTLAYYATEYFTALKNLWYADRNTPTMPIWYMIS